MKNITKKMILVFLILFILFEIVQILIFFLYYKEEKKNLIDETLKSELYIKKKSFTNHFGLKSQDILNAINEDITFTNFVNGEKSKKNLVQNLFLAVAKANRFISQIRYINSDGMEIVKINHTLNDNKIYIVEEKNLQNKADKYYFEDSIFRIPNKIWFSNLDLDKIPIIRVILPLENESGFNGILIVNFDMSEILEGLQKSEYFDNIITNKKGDILLHYDEKNNWSNYRNSSVNLEEFVNANEYDSITKNIEFSNKHLRSLSICAQTKDSIIIVGKIKEKIIKKMHNEFFEKTIFMFVFLSIIFIILSRITLTQIVDFIYKIKKSDDENLELTQALEISEDNWKNAIESSGDGYWDWNYHTDETKYSNNWKKMLGYEVDEINNNLFEWKKRIHPDDYDYVMKENEKFLTIIDYPYSIRFRMQCKDGTYKWIYSQGYIFKRNEEGKPLRLVGTHKDVTKEVNYEKDLEKEIAHITDENFKQLQLLQQQSKLAAMGEMVGAIAHQWRQPLNEVTIRIQKLKYNFANNEINEKFIQDFIAKNKKTINFMSQTIDDFRDFFRIEKKSELFNVNESISNVVNLMESQLKYKNIDLVFNENFVFEVDGYKTEFEHVILNLISNSRFEFENKDIINPIININVEKNRIEYEDNAGGIEDNMLDRIFEPYFTTKEQGQGTGMGLYISKMIIEDNMHGKIYALNTNLGLKFIIELNKKKD